MKTHSGYHSCERCCIKGSYDGRVVFGQNDGNRMFPLTNDEEFHNMAYPAHQQHRSPLLDIDFPCVTGFPLDYMHLVCLGVVRRMLLFLKKGPRVCKLSSQMLARISQKLIA